MNKIRGIVIYVLPLILYCTGLFLFISLPDPQMPSFDFDFADKLNHVGAFFVMTILAYRAGSWMMKERKIGQLILIATLFSALYGAGVEIQQMFVPERSAEIADWLADIVGVLLAIPVIYWMLGTKLRRLVAAEVT
ncbi:MAG: VanZ family protein [Chlorobi bacterium]|nr:VanZ family protein [Chlorobiota bacterium]